MRLRRSYKAALFCLTLLSSAAIKISAQEGGSRFDEYRDASEPGLALKAFVSERVYPYDSWPNDGRRTAWEKAQADIAPLLDTTQPYWNSLGPKPSNSFYSNQGTTSGRINTIAIKPDDPNVVLIGSATGGIWRSADGGTNFSPVTDEQVDLAVGSIAFAPSSPSIAYAGMGDFKDTNYLGYGILKSTDGGQTWTHVNNSSFPSYVGVAKLVVDPTNPNRINAAMYVYQDDTTKSVFGGGFYLSTDGGVNWRRTLSAIARDLAVDVLNPSVVYAAALAFSNTPTFASGIYRSSDGGATWGSTPFYASPYSTTGDMRVAMSSDDTLWVYSGDRSASANTRLAAVDSTGRFTYWTLGPNTVDSGQFSYNTYLAADPGDPQSVYVGSRDVWKVSRAADNQITTTNISKNYFFDATTKVWSFRPSLCIMHSDQQSIAFSPTDPNTIYFGNDGGLYKSTDGAKTARSLNNSLILEQFYMAAIHPTDKSLFIAGAQDNSAQRILSDSASWQQMTTGDGLGAVIDPGSSGTVFILINGNVYRYNDRGLTRASGIAGCASNCSPLTFSEEWPGGRIRWNPPFVGNGTDSKLYYGTWRLFVSSDLGASWSTPGGTTDLTKGSRDVLSVISVSSANPSVIYTGSVQGRVMVSQDAGVTWTDISTGLPNRVVTSIAVDGLVPSTAYLTVSGYSSGHVFKTTNSGGQWTDISGNLPDIPTSAVLPDPANPTTVYLGTDIGVFRSVAGGTTWTAFNNGLPPVVVKAFAAQPGGLIRIATWGRGTYELVTNSNTTSSGTITATPNPCVVTSGVTCTSTVTWTTQNVSSAEVRLVVNGGSEALFARSTSGSAAVPWIGAGNSYKFVLYNIGVSPATQLGSVTVTASVPAGSGTISATPNPCTITSGSACTSTITWSTQNVGSAEVRLSVNSGSEAVFARSTSGSIAVPWIASGPSYKFLLYNITGSPATLLNSVTVTASVPTGSGTITASPNPCTVTSGGACTSTITWSTQSVGSAEVRLSVGGGAEVVFARATSGSIAVPWITSAATYRFLLYNITGSPATLLASVNVTASGGSNGGGPPTLTGISPSSGAPGSTVNVTLTGTNFVSGATSVQFSGSGGSAGITVGTVQVSSSTSLTASFTIASSATIGSRVVTVTTASGTSSGLTFSVATTKPFLQSQAERLLGTWTFTYTIAGSPYRDTFKMTKVLQDNTVFVGYYYVDGTDEYGGETVADYDSDLKTFELLDSVDDYFTFDFTDANTVKGCWWGPVSGNCYAMTGTRTSTATNTRSVPMVRTDIATRQLTALQKAEADKNASPSRPAVTPRARRGTMKVHTF